MLFYISCPRLFAVFVGVNLSQAEDLAQPRVPLHLRLYARPGLVVVRRPRRRGGVVDGGGGGVFGGRGSGRSFVFPAVVVVVRGARRRTLLSTSERWRRSGTRAERFHCLLCVSPVCVFFAKGSLEVSTRRRGGGGGYRARVCCVVWGLFDALPKEEGGGGGEL